MPRTLLHFVYFFTFPGNEYQWRDIRTWNFKISKKILPEWTLLLTKSTLTSQTETLMNIYSLHPLNTVWIKSTAFWVVIPCSSEGARHFEGKYRLHLRENFRLLLPVSCSDYSSTVMMGVIGSPKTMATLRSTQHYSPDDRILHTYRRENLKYNTA
jgi:hypothetical protein